MYQWTVTKKEQNISLLQFLRSKIEDISQKKIKEWIHRNGCMINGRVERFASTRIRYGDMITLRPVVDQLVSILFEDEHLCIYNKPAGIPCEKLQFEGVELVHRLDRDTSGVFIIAKTLDAYKSLFLQFKNKTVEKEYQALVDQRVRQSQGVITSHLAHYKSYDGQKLYQSQKTGRFAETHWTLKERLNRASLIMCFPKTGRTHQIRVHLKEMGHPILGDYQYSRSFHCKHQPLRHMLHASKIQIHHPISQDLLQINAPMPEDFVNVINDLKVS
ncbi:MAG: RluA family pseudouridine synthase [Parachlamydiales bacterium]|nr:RluA family pseudouridine synthase [Parachlamydiales bacterium]